MKYYVVTFTHTKIVGWAIYLHAHVSYLKKMLKEDKLQISGPGVGTPVRSAQLVFVVGFAMIVDAVGGFINWHEAKKAGEADGWMLTTAILSAVFGLALLRAASNNPHAVGRSYYTFDVSARNKGLCPHVNNRPPSGRLFIRRIPVRSVQIPERTDLKASWRPLQSQDFIWLPGKDFAGTVLRTNTVMRRYP